MTAPKEKPLTISEIVEIVTRNFRKMKTRRDVEQQAVKEIGKLIAGLNGVAEQRDQMALLNKVLKDENAKLVNIANALSAEVERLRAENAAMQGLLDQATAPTQSAVPMVGECVGCKHPASFHANKSQVCTSVNCPCMKWQSPPPSA